MSAHESVRPSAPWSARTVAVCVTGGISAYKTATIVSRLAQAGALVEVVMSESATRFVTPLTFQSLSGRPVVSSVWDSPDAADPQHIRLADRLDLAIVAPCSMTTMADLAHGRASSPVTLLLSAVDRARTPVLLAPAMNSVMWAQPSTRRNLAQLREDGFDCTGPDEGWQACRHVGAGRMAEPDAIVEAAGALLG